MNAIKPADKQTAILDAAVLLFATKGFHGTTVPDIALTARVAAGTIYRYFATKEALVNAAFQREKRRLGDALAEAFAGERPSEAQFRRAWSRMVRYAVDNRTGFRFIEMHHHEDYLDETSRAVMAFVNDRAMSAFDAAKAEGIVKPIDSAVLSSLVWGALVGLVKESAGGAFSLSEAVVDASGLAVWHALRRTETSTEPLSQGA